MKLLNIILETVTTLWSASESQYVTPLWTDSEKQDIVLVCIIYAEKISLNALRNGEYVWK